MTRRIDFRPGPLRHLRAIDSIALIMIANNASANVQPRQSRKSTSLPLTEIYGRDRNFCTNLRRKLLRKVNKSVDFNKSILNECQAAVMSELQGPAGIGMQICIDLFAR